MSWQTEQRYEMELTDREADRQVETESNGVEMDSQRDCGHNLIVRHNEDFSKSKGLVQRRPQALQMEVPYHHYYTLVYHCFRDQHHSWFQKSAVIKIETWHFLSEYCYLLISFYLGEQQKSPLISCFSVSCTGAPLSGYQLPNLAVGPAWF